MTGNNWFTWFLSDDDGSNVSHARAGRGVGKAKRGTSEPTTTVCYHHHRYPTAHAIVVGTTKWTSFGMHDRASVEIRDAMTGDEVFPSNDSIVFSPRLIVTLALDDVVFQVHRN